MPNYEGAVDAIKKGKHAVMPTDTLYGVVCDALNQKAVEALYQIKQRNPSKPYIVLIADIKDIARFSIDWKSYLPVLQKYWPGPVSIIMPCADEALSYLHRGTQSLAFRLPADEALRAFLRATGPIVAPSANPEGLRPAATIDEAKRYFGSDVGIYIDGGTITGSPSAIIAVGKDGSTTRLR